MGRKNLQLCVLLVVLSTSVTASDVAPPLSWNGGHWHVGEVSQSWQFSVPGSEQDI